MEVTGVKKIIAFICALVMLISAMPSAFAEEYAFEEKRPEGGMLIKSEFTEFDFEPSYRAVYSSAGTEELLREMMYEGMKERLDVIDISGLNIPASDFNTVVTKAFEDVLYFHPELLIYPVCRGVGDNKDNPKYVIGVVPSYIFSDESEAEAAKKLIEDEIKYYTDFAANVDDAVGKLLVIHDEFARKNAYATEELDAYQEKVKNGTDTDEDMIIFTGYGLFKNNRAVCQGNSIALAAIYNKLGVETGFCQCDAINHIWNVVKIDGKWYQLDETWNDSDVTIGYNADGSRILADKAYHDYFLVTDKTMSDHGKPSIWEYYTDSGAVTCTDARYESGNIFNGDYIYGGYNYGNWYGNISYDGENGRYVADVWARKGYSESSGTVMLLRTGFKPFYSDTIETCGFIATDPYETASGTAVILFAVGNTYKFTDCIYGEYDGDTLVMCKKLQLLYPVAGTSAALVTVPSSLINDDNRGKIFFWEEDNIRPMCETRTIN